MACGAGTIRELRLMTGIRPGTGRDTLHNVEVAALKSEKGSDEEAQKVLLEMADMIRTLSSGTMPDPNRFPKKENDMSVEDYAKSHLVEATGPKDKQPPAGVDDGSMADEKRKLKSNKPKPNKPDPQEVQYPGYFKDEGSL